MLKFIAGIGVPGSGKSTYLKPFAEQYGHAYVSSDEVRGEFVQDLNDMSRNPEVWEEVRRRIAHSLESGISVVFDSTLSKREDRLAYIEFARNHGAEKIQGVYMDATAEEAKEANMERERQVPEHVIDRMEKQLQELPVELSEGFDSIVIFDGQHELREVRVRHESEGEMGQEMKKEFKIR